MTKTQFINHVLHLLNEAGSIDGAEMVGADMTQLNLYIENLFPGAYRRAVNIPTLKPYFENTSFAANTHVVNAPDGTGYVILPENYLALQSFKMTGWKTNVLEAQAETPQVNRKQANEYTRGSVQRPVCVLRFINHENALKRALYYYSLPRRADASGHSIEQALYIANVSTLADEINISEQLFEPLAHICAAAVLTSFEKTDAAKAIEAELIKLI